MSPLNALMPNQMNKLRGHLYIRILKEHSYSVGQKVDGSTTTEQLKMVPLQILFANPEIFIYLFFYSFIDNYTCSYNMLDNREEIKYMCKVI